MSDDATGLRAALAQLAAVNGTTEAEARRAYDDVLAGQQRRLIVALPRQPLTPFGARAAVTLTGRDGDLFNRLRAVYREHPEPQWRPLQPVPVAPSGRPGLPASLSIDADDHVHVIRSEGRDRISYTVDGADVLARCRAVAAKYLPEPPPPRPESLISQAAAAFGVPRSLLHVKA